VSCPAWRSLLFVPADDRTRCAKAARAGADAVILDLEDGVGASLKVEARGQLALAVRELGSAGASIVVRINVEWRAALADLEAAVIAGVRAMMIPKVNHPARLQVLGEMIGELEQARGLPIGATGLVPLIESPASLAAITLIAAAPRVIGLGLGSEDYCLELGVAPSRQALDLPSRLIAAAAAPALMALAVPYSIAAYRDIDGFHGAALASAMYGVTGALCIHPGQVKAANDAFSTSEAQCEEARRLLAVWSQAQAAGRAVASFDGRMIDRPIAERARAILARRHDQRAPDR
jgi:citrate lyase subunit beta/citryl-CoA lyase